MTSEKNITPESSGIDLDAALEAEISQVADMGTTATPSTPNPTSLDGKSVAVEEVLKDTPEALQKHATVATETTEDPFARISKKKVAKPKSMNDIVKGKVKKGRKISPKWFLIGCGFFFLFFLGMSFAGLYFSVTSSSKVLQGIGLTVADVKSILLIFAVLFFGIIFFIGFYLFVLNIYRLVTAKGKKVKYVAGLIGGIVVLALAIVSGTLSINKINELTVEEGINTTQIVLPYVVTRDKPIWLGDGVPMIAPFKMKYQLNKDQIDRQIRPSIDNAVISAYTVDCGNEQTLSAGQAAYLGQNNGFFGGHCLYMTKGNYPVSLTVTYTDGQTNTQETKTFNVGELPVNAEISLEAQDDTSYYNDFKTEYVIGIAPVSIRFRAQNLFTELGLSEDLISWDLDADGTIDIENNATFEYPYSDSKLHTLAYQLPGLGAWADTWFTFDLRVVESELARCELSVQETDAARRKYKITPKFDELVQVQNYHYTIYDTLEDSIVDKFKESKDTASVTFPKGGIYQVQASYFTPDGKKGSCTSETLDVGFNGNQVSFDLRRKQKEAEPFSAAGQGTPVVLDTEENEVNVTLLPAILEFSITDIAPDPTAKLTAYYQGTQVFPDRDDVYEVNIDTLGEKEFTFALETKQGNKTEQAYTINVSREPLKARMLIEPDTVGEDPFEVTLDSSISDLYNEDDEIVYFSWDFGDGETRENVSQGKIRHTYVFDTETDSGEYYPAVTIKTKLGYEDTYRSETPITVKRKQRTVKVRVDSHPTQQVKVGETVQLSLETDGQVKSIDWNYGNEKSYSCDDRSCANSSMRYATPGEYIISAEIQYENDSPVIGRVKIKVYE